MSLELRILGLMKAMVENPGLNKETVLKQIGDAEQVANVKMREIVKNRDKSYISIDEEEPIQSNCEIQNKVNQNMSTNF